MKKLGQIKPPGIPRIEITKISRQVRVFGPLLIFVWKNFTYMETLSGNIFYMEYLSIKIYYLSKVILKLEDYYLEKLDYFKFILYFVSLVIIKLIF